MIASMKRMTQRHFISAIVLAAILVTYNTAMALASSTAPLAIFKESAYNLRPTQPVVGFASVEQKSKILNHMTKRERIAFLKAHPVPVVVGPDLNYYLIDHHHLTRAVIEIGHKRVYVQVVADLSKLSKEKFWAEMQRRNYLYLFDAFGQAIAPEDLPTSILDLQDDPYRSLAYFARKEGAFDKSPTPFAEFMWAAFYRKIIPFERLRDWKTATTDAISVSRTYEGASHLPGFLGNLVCIRAFGYTL